MEEIFVGLIDRWIPGTEQYDAGILRVVADPDSTIDFVGSSDAQITPAIVSNDNSAEFTVPILYNDPEITRIIMLLKQINNPMEKIAEIFQQYQQVRFLYIQP